MDEVSVSLGGGDHQGVATIVIDRPQARNAISQAVMGALSSALDRVEAAGARVLVIRGGGDRAFISGGDVKDLASLRTHSGAAGMATRMRDVLDRLASFPALTLAVVNGHALGGGAEVAIACDLRVAVDDVSIAFNQSQLAILPAWGGVERLVGLVGRSRALELLLTPRRLTAAEARMYGLVNEVVPRHQLEQRVDDITRAAAQLPDTVLLPMLTLANELQPPTSPGTAGTAIRAFADAWVSETHWEAVRLVDARRSAQRAATRSARQ